VIKDDMRKVGLEFVWEEQENMRSREYKRIDKSCNDTEK
jgi:hypothetical protein